jgi:hypothetical protein
METGAVIALIAAAVVVLLLVALALPALRHKREEKLRERAGDERYEARSRQLAAERAQAGADERAARARRQSALAEERAREASREREAAGEHMERASALDPDVEEDEQRDADGSDRDRHDGETRRRLFRRGSDRERV